MTVSELLQPWETATINTSVALSLAKRAGIRPFPATSGTIAAAGELFG